MRVEQLIREIRVMNSLVPQTGEVGHPSYRQEEKPDYIQNSHLHMKELRIKIDEKINNKLGK